MKPVIARLADELTRSFRAPHDLDAISDIGEEHKGPETDLVWERALEFYRKGVHPAVQLCIRYQGRVVLDRAIGHARAVKPGKRPGDADMPLRTDTPVNVFSAAKAIMAIVMHKLEENGVLSLDEPIASYLDGFERFGKESITTRQVLNHQAGIPSIPPHMLDLDILGDPARIRQFVLDLKPSRQIGGPPAYHAISGGFVLDILVRELTGMSLRDVLERDFKQPLGLRWFDFGVSVADTHKVAQNAVSGLRLDPVLAMFMRRLIGVSWNKVVKLSNDPRFISGVIPSGNLIATARDVATFYQCILDYGVLGDTRVLAPETVDRVFDPQGSRPAVDRLIGMPLHYVNGFMMGSRYISLYGWNHPRAFGHIGMSNTFTWADPDRELVVALLTTGKPIIGPHLLALFRLITEIHQSYPVVQKQAATQPVAG